MSHPPGHARAAATARETAHVPTAELDAVVGGGAQRASAEVRPG